MKKITKTITCWLARGPGGLESIEAWDLEGSDNWDGVPFVFGGLGIRPRSKRYVKLTIIVEDA